MYAELFQNQRRIITNEKNQIEKYYKVKRFEKAKTKNTRGTERIR